ncbi:hypothetical protein, partial [Streptomyces mirabilis]|uniref:hypothetical protein n=1 Tax=Streptomyces mirabilis TaxID=68239 RepID=UPI0033DB61D7
GRRAVWPGGPLCAPGTAHLQHGGLPGHTRPHAGRAWICHRSAVERCVSDWKQYRAVATR